MTRSVSRASSVLACVAMIAWALTASMAPAAGTPYVPSLMGGAAGFEAVPHGCTQTICNLTTGTCSKDPGSLSKCKKSGGSCFEQGC